MKRIRHVFTATDLSDHALPALERSFQLAQAAGLRLTVMTALGLDALGPLRNLLGDRADEVTQRALAQRRAELEALVGVPRRNRGVTAGLLVEEGLATTVVPARAIAADADLVVVGARGESLMRRLLIGSTASRLLRKSRCPVLVVRHACRGPYRRVLVPVDFSPGSALTVEIARELAPDAHLVLLHVFDVPFEGMLQHAGVQQDTIHRYRIEARQRAMRQLHALAAPLEAARASFTTLVEHGDATAQILAQQAHHRCDLVVMGKHGTHVTEELLLGSVTKRVLSEARADVLVVVDKRGVEPEPPPGGAH